jgi:hypothetical protein
LIDVTLPISRAEDLCQIGYVLDAIVRTAAIASLLGSVLAAGCSNGGSEATTCPNDYPTACAAPGPSFANDVGALIHTNCTPCHGPGQQPPALVTYSDIMHAGTLIATQVSQCRMPPVPRAPLTSQQRQTLFDWLVCGAMNN